MSGLISREQILACVERPRVVPGARWDDHEINDAMMINRVAPKTQLPLY